MSGTPRTLQEECYGTCWAACERIEELEAQVRAAANHIKRLEEAGEKMVDEPLRKHRRWILNEAKQEKP